MKILPVNTYQTQNNKKQNMNFRMKLVLDIPLHQQGRCSSMLSELAKVNEDVLSKIYPFKKELTLVSRPYSSLSPSESGRNGHEKLLLVLEDDTFQNAGYDVEMPPLEKEIYDGYINIDLKKLLPNLFSKMKLEAETLSSLYKNQEEYVRGAEEFVSQKYKKSK